MAADSESTVRGRDLGGAIRLAMESAEINGKRLAELLDWSETKVSRILTGHMSPLETEVAAILAMCGVVGGRRDSLLDLCRTQALSNWSTDRDAVFKHQQGASKIIEFHNSLIPSLLQIEHYARLLIFRMVNMEECQIESWLAMQMRSQTVLDRPGPKRSTFTFFVHQLALELPLGGNEVMSSQLHHVLRMAVRRHVSIRIVPSAIGAYPGSCGPFRFIDYPDFQPIVYVEDEVEGHFLEERDKVTAYQRLIAALSAVSLDATESIRLIREKAECYDNTRLNAAEAHHSDG